MTNLVKNKDEVDFDVYLKNGLNILKNAKIFYFLTNCFITEMDAYPDNYNNLYTIRGGLTDINGKTVSILFTLSKKSNYKLVMECMPYKDYIPHMNNSLVIVNIEKEKSFVMVVNENENDLVNVTRTIAPKTTTTDTTNFRIPPYSSSIKGFKALYYYLIFIGVGLFILIIIAIVCCITKRKREYENDVVSQVSSNSSEPQYYYPKN